MRLKKGLLQNGTAYVAYGDLTVGIRLPLIPFVEGGIRYPWM